ncbi:uncharacterized protein LOC144093679 [Amblyomma americanum]
MAEDGRPSHEPLERPFVPAALLSRDQQAASRQYLRHLSHGSHGGQESKTSEVLKGAQQCRDATWLRPGHHDRSAAPGSRTAGRTSGTQDPGARLVRNTGRTAGSTGSVTASLSQKAEKR